MKIEKIKQEYLNFKYLQTEYDYKKVLDNILKQIRFLENIYMTNKEWNVFSSAFSDLAYKERQDLCIKSSALYDILRDIKEEGF